jgi:MFS transporter, ACS family, glucarate transporter
MSQTDLDFALEADQIAPGRDSRVRYLVLAAACCLAIVAYLHRVGFATAAPELKQQTGLSDYDLSSLMAAFMLAYGLVEIPIGVLGDKLGVRHVLTALVVGWSVLTGLIGCVLWLPPNTLWPLVYLLLLRAAFGMFQGGLFPLTSRLLADWMPVSERGLAQGCLWTSSRLGGALAPVVVVQLFHTVGIGQAAFWMLAAVGFVWAALFWPWFRGTPEQMPGVNAVELKTIEAGRSNRPHVGHGAVPWGRLLGSRSAWCLCLMYGGLALTGNFFITLLPAYLRTHRHLTLETARWVAATPLACGIVGCVLGGFLSDQIIRRSRSRRWGRRVVGSFGLALGATALAATILVDNPVWLAALLGLAFFGNDLAMGPAWASCADIGERYAGTLGGAMNMTGSITGALGALMIGRMLNVAATTPLFLILAASYLAGSLLWWGVDVSKPIADGPA